MTHDILQTDIELAKEMIGSNRPADEVARALARRGIDLPAATQLVDDLRNGRPVRPQLTPPEFVSAARSSQRRTSNSQDQTEQARPQSPGSRPSTDRPSRRRSRGASKASPVVWFVAGIFGCVLLTGAALVFKHWRHGRADSQELTQPKDLSSPLQANARSSASPAQPSTRIQNPSTRGIAMEVRTDGLYLGEAQLTKGKAWANIAKVLGSPTRTNQFMKGPRQVFAYDQHGILLYGE